MVATGADRAHVGSHFCSDWKMQVNDRLAILAKAKDYLLHSIPPRDVYYTKRLMPTELVDRFT